VLKKAIDEANFPKGYIVVESPHDLCDPGYFRVELRFGSNTKTVDIPENGIDIPAPRSCDGKSHRERYDYLLDVVNGAVDMLRVNGYAGACFNRISFNDNTRQQLSCEQITVYAYDGSPLIGAKPKY
jgi:hypothetical protein